MPPESYHHVNMGRGRVKNLFAVPWVFGPEEGIPQHLKIWFNLFLGLAGNRQITQTFGGTNQISLPINPIWGGGGLLLLLLQSLSSSSFSTPSKLEAFPVLPNSM